MNPVNSLLKPVLIFISYAREDIRYMKNLDGHLQPLIRGGKIECWHDQMIEKGEKWKEVLLTKLSQSRVFVILVSRHSFYSDYIQKVEQAIAIKLYERGEMIFLPVLVRSFNWEETLYKDFQMITYKNAHIAKEKDQESAWDSVVQDIRNKLQTEFPYLWEKNIAENKTKIEKIFQVNKNDAPKTSTLEKERQENPELLIVKNQTPKLKKTKKTNILKTDDPLIFELENLFHIMKKDKHPMGSLKILTQIEIEDLLKEFRLIEKDIRPMLVGKNINQVLPDALIRIDESMNFFTDTIKKCAHHHTSNYIEYANRILESCSLLRKCMIETVSVTGITPSLWLTMGTDISNLHSNILLTIIALEDLLSRASKFSQN
jgi:hypothetical protein